MILDGFSRKVVNISGVRRRSHMGEWLWLIAFFVAYLVLTQWLLPKLGVPT